MSENPGKNSDMWRENFIEEIEKARTEIDLAEKAFQWVKNDLEAVDAALSRIEAAIDHYNFLIKQAKEQGIFLDKKVMYSKLLNPKKYSSNYEL